MAQEEIPYTGGTKKQEGGSKMALLAAPCKDAFCIDSKNVDILNKRSPAILEALRKIRKAEASNSNDARLRQLDKKIEALQEQDKRL